MVKHAFPKSAKLCGQTNIDHLYAHGKRFVAWPLRVTALECEDATQVLVWAPKSLFKRAVDRNRIKRLMRESYRLNKELLSGCDGGFEVAFVSISDAVPSFEFMQKKMCEALMLLKGKE